MRAQRERPGATGGRRLRKRQFRSRRLRPCKTQGHSAPSILCLIFGANVRSTKRVSFSRLRRPSPPPQPLPGQRHSPAASPSRRDASRDTSPRFAPIKTGGRGGVPPETATAGRIYLLPPYCAALQNLCVGERGGLLEGVARVRGMIACALFGGWRVWSRARWKTRVRDPRGLRRTASMR